MTGRTKPRRLLASTLILSPLLALLWHSVASALLPSAAPDRTNSPPVNVTCDRAGCHNPQAGAPQGTVAVTGIPTCYNPGESYNFTVTVSDSSARRWGFELSVQYNEGNSNDTLSAGELQNNTPNQKIAMVVGGTGTRQFMTHDADSPDGDGTYPGQANSASWTMTWTAPTERITNVCIYVAGVAANNNGGRSGDRTYQQKYCIGPCGPTRVPQETWGSIKGRYVR